MKKYIISSIFLFFIVHSISAQIRVNSKDFEYAEGVTFSVKGFMSDLTSEYGDGDDQKIYIAKGGRFKTAILKFTNNTEEDVVIDFQKFELIDNADKRYFVHGASQSMKIINTMEKFKLTLKAGKTKTFMATFWPPYPKKEQVTRMIVNDEIIILE